MSVVSGPATIFMSGIATTFFGHPLEIPFSNGSVALVVRFVFDSDPTEPGPAVRSAPHGSGLDLTLVNFQGVDGKGSRDPVLLGKVGDDLLFLHFRVFQHGSSPDFTVHYTAYVTSAEAFEVRSLESSEGA